MRQFGGCDSSCGIQLQLRYLKKEAKIVEVLYKEQRLESREDIGFAPIGLDEPYRIVVGNNPVNFVDPLGLYDIDVHLGMTYIWAKQIGFQHEEALAVAMADQGVDENWDTTWKNPFGGCQMHFLPRAKAASAINKAIEKRDFTAFGVALHLLQDSYSHEGYECYKGGHIPDTVLRGINPDIYCSNSSRDKEMKMQTKKYLRRFLGKYRNYLRRKSIY